MSGSKTIHNPNGAFGYTAVDDKLFRQEAEMKTSAAVSGPKVVAIGTTGLVATAATDGTASLAIGVCVNSPASGDIARVVTYGIAKSVPVDGSVAASSVLKRSATTAGSLAATASPATGEAIAVAIAASAANVADVWVCKAL